MAKPSSRPELHERSILPAPRWLRVTAWALTGVAVLLNALNLPGVIQASKSLHNAMGLAWTFGTHVALALALTCALRPLLRKRALSRRGALKGALLALVSILLFPLSYAAVIMASFERWEFTWR